MAKANGVVWLVNLTVLAVLSLFGFSWLSLLLTGYLSKMLFLETGLALLIGGAMAFSGGIFPSKVREHFGGSNEKWSVEKLRKSEKTANMYLVLGVVLFVQCLLVSFLIY
jgi:hypothetical protein